MKPPAPRLPLDPLVEMYGSISSLALALGRQRAQVQRWSRDGVPLSSADRIAVGLGWHPVEIWPEWYTVTADSSAAA